MNNENYKQFEGMKIPIDIKPLPILSRQEITEKIKRKIDISRTFVISLNTNQFRPNEVHVHTADIGSNYEPDFDFLDLDEADQWRKTCKLKYNLQQFSDVDLVRCEGFFHKMQICESLTLFEEVNRMLKDEGKFLIVIFDLFKCMKSLIEQYERLKNVQLLSDNEKLIFSAGDSTGIYYNRTIWTLERLKIYLQMANFSKVENLSTNDNFLRLVATKTTKV